MNTSTTDTTNAGRRDTGRTRAAATALATTLGAAAVAATVLAPTADARASHTTVWDRVAGCESSHRWHINTGNGFYGGLQFTDRTWDAYGGNTYAGRADHASRAEQIEVARRVLHAQGPHAWPVCGPRAGLTRSSGHATGSHVPHTAGSTTHHTSKAHGAHKAKHASHKTAAHHTHHGKHRAGGYTVHSGDTLSGIARSHHTPGGWHAIYRANRAHLSNPNVLHVGQHLTLP